MGSNVYDLTANQNRIITIERKYFLIDKFGKTFTADKGNFFYCFPLYKGAIQDYLKDKNIHFNSIEDLKKLFKFCNEQH